MKIAGRDGTTVLVIRGATFALAAFIGWGATSRQRQPGNDRVGSGLHLWLGDTVYSGKSEPTTVGYALNQLEKPAVVFTFRESCSMCLTEFDVVEAVARKAGIQLWMLVVTDSIERWEPPATVVAKLDMRPARVARATADGWGIRETPAIIELGLGNRLLLFRQGAGAAMEFKAIMWHPADSTSPVGESVVPPDTLIPVASDR